MIKDQKLATVHFVPFKSSDNNYILVEIVDVAEIRQLSNQFQPTQPNLTHIQATQLVDSLLANTFLEYLTSDERAQEGKGGAA